MSKIPADVLAVYQHGQASSWIVVVVFAILSVVAMGFFLAHVSWISLHMYLAARGVAASQERKRSFFQTQLGVYTVSLLLSNFITSIAFLINARWFELKRVESGSLCHSQAVLRQIGGTATAYFTGAIAAHAFISLICHRAMPPWFSSAAVAFGWAISIVIGEAPAPGVLPLFVKSNKLGLAYGFNGLSCGISPGYSAFEVVLTIVPEFLAILVAIAVYWLIFLVLGGALSIHHGLKLCLKSDANEGGAIPAGQCPQYYRFVKAVAKSLVWYPIAYTFFSFPSLVVIMMRATRDHVPFGLQVFADTSSAMLGLANSLVLLRTLRILSPYLVTQLPQDAPLGDSDSFFAPSASPIDLEVGATERQQSGGIQRRQICSSNPESLMSIYSNPSKRDSLPVSVLKALVDAVSHVATSHASLSGTQKDFAPIASTGNTIDLVSPFTLSSTIPHPTPTIQRPSAIPLLRRSTLMKPLPPSPCQSKSPLLLDSTIDMPPRSASSSFYERRQIIPEDIDPGKTQPPTKPGTRPSTISISSMHEHMAALSPPSSRSPRFRGGDLPSDRRQTIASSTSPCRGLPASPRMFKMQQEMAQVSLPNLPAAVKHPVMQPLPTAKRSSVQRPFSYNMQLSHAAVPSSPASSPAKVAGSRPLPRVSMIGASAFASIPEPPAGTLASRRSVRTTVSASLTSASGYI
ncbi:uncharacterized protein FIBRA_04378 [Fibroporia radiculosa]|uniref:G-protein coupled receptors family 1 profile domain-containing protein n=1 Tax=Fibroporia radiculosa TaxID=599839 RepID=J4GP61_9APHY|nr:uncharacterized protein FIBRA_04378 [Fibroporia radiculosa]CCM02290.1 predicted protein [Fibroporia radiculosa]